MNIFLSFIFGSLVGFRNWLYDAKIFRSRKVGVPVICVGNLTVGGTGKTPVVEGLLRELSKAGVSAGYISRGYRGNFGKWAEVIPAPGIYFGDEAEMIKAKFPNIPVFVGADRARVAEKLLFAQKVEVIVTDDGFQHRKLHRDLDIVVIDLLKDLKEYFLLPEGRAREPLSSLSRAQVVVFSRANLLPDDIRKERIQFFERYIPKGVLKVEMNSKLRRLKNMKTGEGVTLKNPSQVSLVSAIGNPNAFAKVMQLIPGIEIMDEQAFRDHHAYSKEDIEICLELARKSQSQWLITTEKDEVKIKKLDVDISKILVAELNTEFGVGGPELFQMAKSV